MSLRGGLMIDLPSHATTGQPPGAVHRFDTVGGRPAAALGDARARFPPPGRAATW
jgi:hypothetical protein